MFRTPIDHTKTSERFYKTRYESGFTTSLPNIEELRQYMERAFRGTPKDFRRYLNLFQALGVGEGARVLDLGCSWGYGAWQFQRAGYQVVGMEPGKVRANYARQHLGVDVFSSVNELRGKFDVIFSSHVLEHVANLHPLLQWCDEHLTADGIFVAVTPNGSAAFRRLYPDNWSRFWGAVHPLLLDDEYWSVTCKSRPYLITSSLGDTEAVAQWTNARVQTVGPTNGWELMVVYRNSQQIAGVHCTESTGDE